MRWTMPAGIQTAYCGTTKAPVSVVTNNICRENKLRLRECGRTVSPVAGRVHVRSPLRHEIDKGNRRGVCLPVSLLATFSLRGWHI